MAQAPGGVCRNQGCPNPLILFEGKICPSCNSVREVTGGELTAPTEAQQKLSSPAATDDNVGGEIAPQPSSETCAIEDDTFEDAVEAPFSQGQDKECAAGEGIPMQSLKQPNERESNNGHDDDRDRFTASCDGGGVGRDGYDQENAGTSVDRDDRGNHGSSHSMNSSPERGTQENLRRTSSFANQPDYDYKDPPRPTTDVVGLNATHTLPVTFHCILPKSAWKWNYASSIHLRFEVHDLKDSNFGDFTQGREIEKYTYEMTCTLKISTNLIQDEPLLYKYVVYSPKMTKEEDSLEVLHSCSCKSHKGLMRYLQICGDREGKKHHKYDFYVYPKHDKSWWNPTAYFNKDPTIEVMSKKCLLFYLKPWKDQLVDDFEVDELAMDIVHVFESHQKPQIRHLSRSCASWLVRTDLKKDYEEWLEGIVNDLHNSRHKLISSLCVVWCAMHSLEIWKKAFVHPLLKVLQIELHKEGCFSNMDFLLTMDSISKNNLRKAILRLCQAGMDELKQGDINWDWLHVLPLCHFLSDYWQPNTSLEYDPNKIQFDARATEYGYENIKSLSWNAPLLLDQYSSLEPLFHADPLLLYDFIYLCPQNCYQALFQKLPAFLSLTALQKLDCAPSEPQWSSWLKEIWQKAIEETNKKEIEATLHAVMPFVLNLFEFNEVHVLTLSISILLYSLSKMEKFTSERSLDVFKVLEESFKNWIARETGGDIFGGKQGAPAEFKQWQSILSLQLPQDKKIEDAWIECVRKVIKPRLQEVPNDRKLDLITILEEKGERETGNCDMLSREIIDVAKGAVDTMSDYGSLERFKDSKTTGELYGWILLKKYEILKTSGSEFYISLDELLSWPYWCDFIRIYESPSSKTREGLSEECAIACRHAINCMKQVFKNFQSKDITVLDLEKIETNYAQMEQLWDEMMEQKLELKSVCGTLQKQLEVFEKDCRCLEHICEILDTEIDGVSEARKELKTNYKEWAIKHLKISEERFPKASVLFLFAKKYNVMEKSKSRVFSSIWSRTVEQAKCNCSNLTINDIDSKIWIPTIEDCKKMLATQTITFETVNSLFKPYQESDLTSELRQLFSGINEMEGFKQPLSDDRIQDIVKRIVAYRKLCDQKQIIELFFSLRDLLKLSQGDFTDIESISECLVTEHKTLKDISEDMIHICHSFSQIIGGRLECIQKFCECQKIVQWIRDNTRDVNDLQNFANVALDTAAGGEDAYAKDMLSSLCVVGNGFSSLIYQINEGIGFRELYERCSSVWDAFENNHKLSTILVSCNESLEWYKSVKETQGSVEATTFGQMNNIMACGYYTVTGSRDTTIISFQDAIQVTLVPPEGKKPHRTSYKLEDLRELEIKLVLITGVEAENRETVENFLNIFHCVCRIAEVLIKHQQVGNVQYIGWRMEFSCRENFLDDLQNQAKTMEHELGEWNNKVLLTRKKFYELNYYTTCQLLVLRSELGQLKESKGKNRLSQHSQVLALLGSISTDITPTIIEDVVHSIVSTRLIQERQARSEAETQPSLRSQPLPAQHQGCVSLVTGVALPISKEDLNVTERKQLKNLTEKYGVDENKAVQSIKRFSGNWNDIETWLKTEQCHGGDDISEYDTMSDDESLYSGSEQSEDEWNGLNVVPPQSPGTSPPPNSQSRVVMTHREPVDENNREVQLLRNAEMGTLDQCIRAIKVHETARVVTNRIMQMSEEFFEDGSVPIDHVCEEAMLPREEIMQSEKIMITEKSVEDQYLQLEELGLVLQKLGPNIMEERKLTGLKPGQPHLLVVPEEQVLRTALSLYMKDDSLPMPTLEELLICNQNTTIEEVSLLWNRAVFDPGFRRIFCLVHAERLSYQTADKVLQTLTDIIQGRKGYRLVIICSSQNGERSLIISKLHVYRRPYGPTELSKCKIYLRNHIINRDDVEEEDASKMSASVVDYERSCVRVVRSDRAGMGKTFYIIQMAEKLQSKMEQQNLLITIPIHGPVVTADSVMEYLVKYCSTSHCVILHFDISPLVLWQVNDILFSLLIQRGLHDSQGRVWRYLFKQLYVIEVTIPQITSTTELSVIEMMPQVNCVNPKKALSLMRRNEIDANQIVMNENEFKSVSFQRVYQYLYRYSKKADLDKFIYKSINKEGSSQHCLQIMLDYCGVKDPSWAEIRHFVKFLDLQLQSCEHSKFCNVEFVGDVLAGFRTFVVKFIICMSRDFSMSSLRGEIALENDEEDEIEDIVGHYQIKERKLWEQSAHPYLFFNQDQISITFVGFMVSKAGDLYECGSKGGLLEKEIMSEQLYEGLKAQRVNFHDDYSEWDKKLMIHKLVTVIGIESSDDPDPTYVLTVDNVIKMLAIHMRFRCGIPVIIMGETGCGKTRLIRYMCDLMAGKCFKENLLIMKVHGGTSEEDIIEFMQKAERQAEKNRTKNLSTVVFFDEANTTEAIGLIKELMCDRRLCGDPISQDLKFIAACNPYRKHSESMNKTLHSAGLGFYVSNTQQKLGKIPLRELVYRVIDLPPSMKPLIYDFGTLEADREREYIIQIVNNHLKEHPTLLEKHKDVLINILAWSQNFMRKRKEECSFVSLRDVERAMIVFTYFITKMELLRDTIQKMETKMRVATSISDLTRSLILAVSVCYHARLANRCEYEREIVNQFTDPFKLPGGEDRFRNEIKWCQEVLLESMMLGDNIACNAALRENVFMMMVCVDLRIPLFLIGKPGSSKSLAKAIVANSMRGQKSQNDLLKSFKRVHMFSYQCSQLSTSQSIIEVFNTAKHFQNGRDVIPVVVLDEVGLAEDSPNLPLKALHPLLEDGTEGADTTPTVLDRESRVAFIGISNWALDPAKMNRGIMVIRGDPDHKELVFSAKGICHNENIQKRLSIYFEPLAKAYCTVCKAICKEEAKPFFGLRDFYCLIKMLYWMCEKTNMPLTRPQLVHAIKRNFGGFKTETFDPENTFLEILPKNVPDFPDQDDILDDIQHFVFPDNSPRGLIQTSLKTKEKSWHGENRYLLFLTENFAALEILNQYLKDEDGEANGHPEQTTQNSNMEAFILFGSSFPRDEEYTQVCRNINQIKICMEIGRTVILLNLENLYESLYDVLNQYYVHHGENRYVDLGLQTHRLKCRVHDNFKLIMIAEKTAVYKEFPTPLINRLEKHFVLYSSVLTELQKLTLEKLKKWIENFSHVRTLKNIFNEKDAFVGYHKDAAAAVVFQATNQLQKTLRKQGECSTQPYLWESVWRDGLLGNWTLEKLSPDTESWQDTVLLISQFLMLQTATPPALIRLRKSELKSHYRQIIKLYHTQCHNSIEDFLSYHLSNKPQIGLLMQVTTHSHILSSDEIYPKSDKLDVHCFLLQAFDTELDFTSKISPFFMQDESSNKDCLLIIQCDSGHINGNLIACARYRVYDARAKAILKKSKRLTHVVLIIHLPFRGIQSSFIGFQGDPWISCHIDELKPSDISFEGAQGLTISDLFYGKTKQEQRKTHKLGRQPSNLNEDDELAERQDGRQESMGMQTEETESTSSSATLEKSMDQEEQQKENREETLSECDATGSDMCKQCVRLSGYIQASASRLHDARCNKQRSAKRVELLINVIPRKPIFPLETNTFYTILVSHIYRILHQRESKNMDDDWVLNEALDSQNLHIGGTFNNVLTRKLDEVVVSYFAEVIAFLDRNCNLNLLERAPFVSQLWLKIWDSQRVKDTLCYSDMLGIQRVLMHDDEFTCRFPFSWLVEELMESHLDDAFVDCCDHEAICTKLCSTTSETNLGKILMSAQDKQQCMELYLHDFLHIMYKSNHRIGESREQEYKHIQNCLDDMITKHYNAEAGTPMTLIAAIHVLYKMNSECIQWFGELTSHYPGIITVPKHKGVEGENECTILLLHALDAILSELKPPFDANVQSHYGDLENAKTWLNKLQDINHVIEISLSLPSKHLATEARMQWQKIKVMQFFMEQVVSKHEDMIVYARRFDLILEDAADFLTFPTLNKVVQMLQKMYSELRGKLKNEDERKKLTSIRKSIINFFEEVLSSLCFGQASAPDNELIKMLLDIMFVEQPEGGQGGEGKMTEYTRALAPFHIRDQKPIIRSLLLQLLLNQNPTSVKDHLTTYFSKSQQALIGCAEMKGKLCVFFTQCFEDSIYKQYCGQPIESRMEAIGEQLASSTGILLQFIKQRTLSMDLLEAIAKIRYALAVFAEMLQLRVDHNHAKLTKEVRHLCTDTIINTTGRHIAVYLLKLLVHQIGYSCLRDLVKTPNNNLEWLHTFVSGEFKERDPFVIYNPNYSSMKRDMHCSGDLEHQIKDLEPKEHVVFLLSVYEVYTMSRVSLPPIPPEAIEKANFMILNCNIPKKMKIMARKLVANEQGGPLEALTVTANQPGTHTTLTTIVVHVVASLRDRENFNIFSPLVTLLATPGDLVESYIPSMPDDIFFAEDRTPITGGHFYECLNGHPHYIGECGQKTAHATCNVCDSALRRRDHLKLCKRRAKSMQAGYVLGHPTSRGSSPQPERSLSPAACCILRAIMHSALLWASCNDVNGLLELVKSGLRAPNELPEFFLGHLVKDLELLGRALGRNKDESAVVVHLVLKKMNNSDDTCDTPTNLESKKQRNEWEKEFAQMYIYPVIEKLEAELGETMMAVLDDDKDHDPLYDVVYKNMPAETDLLEHQLYDYQPQNTVELLFTFMQSQKKQFPVIIEFLKKGAMLQACQYLPDIVQLQTKMFEEFHHRIKHRLARIETMMKFVQRKTHTEHLRNKYIRMVTSVQKAWNLVRDELKDHDQLKVEDEILQQQISLDSTLDFFIPTTIGPGASTFALVHYLAFVHNNFIDWCRTNENKTRTWHERKIRLTHIQTCHLMAPYSQLDSILLSHCHYTLCEGKSYTVSFDLPALQKHILKYFIHGKPRILVEIPQVSYQKDIYTAETFAAVRKRVANQVSLEPQVQKLILQELGRAPDKLRRCLDAVEIVLGFLATGGGKASTKVRKYLKKLQMDDKTLSKEIKEHCNLEHILSLWQILSVALAREIHLSDQEAFHTLNHDLLVRLSEIQRAKLKEVLPKFDLSSLLCTLYEFIETYIRHTDMQKWENGLVKTLILYLESNDLPVPQEVRDELPRDITLVQTVDTWKCIVFFQVRKL